MITFRNLKFCEVWPDYDSFKDDYDSLIQGFPQLAAPLTNNSVKTTFYLLFASFGNTPILNTDVNQFKMKIVSTMFTYGPTWERKQAIQKTVRDLTESDLLVGAKQIYNHAFNPSAEPFTGSLEELNYINDQNTASHKKSKMEAYSILWSLLHAEATTEYIAKFKKCFSYFVDKMFEPFYIDNDDQFIIIEGD